MDEFLDNLSAFYQIDQSTFVLLLLLCWCAAYSIRNYLTNPATIVILAPLFFLVGATVYALALHHSAFSPRRTVEWLTFMTFSAAIGAILGIMCVAVLRVIQDKFITASHIRATLRRDAEQSARGYVHPDAISHASVEAGGDPNAKRILASATASADRAAVT